jgi:hypothetical protein
VLNGRCLRDAGASRPRDIGRGAQHGERRECGLLTDRADGELESTIAALDPSMDYGYDAEAQECESSPGAWIHIEGFEHSPFACSWMCCRPELIRAALIYSLVESHFVGLMPLVDGEPYVAIEPDRLCP